MAWDHVKGTFSPAPRARLPERDRAPHAELSHFTLTAEWRDWWRVAPRASEDDRIRAVQKLASLILRLNGGDELTPPLPRPSEDLVVTLDLDHTLWDGECIEWPAGSFECSAAVAPAGGPWRRRKMQSRQPDESGRYDVLELYGEVGLVFGALHAAGVTIAIASASPAEDSAKELLRGFDLYDDALGIEMGDHDKRKKVGHIERLARRLKVPSEEVRRRSLLRCHALM
eukprot:2284842-Prymnesium_polylepis.2